MKEEDPRYMKELLQYPAEAKDVEYKASVKFDEETIFHAAFATVFQVDCILKVPNNSTSHTRFIYDNSAYHISLNNLNIQQGCLPYKNLGLLWQSQFNHREN